jgi:SAM-dependent methyltransferase
MGRRAFAIAVLIVVASAAGAAPVSAGVAAHTHSLYRAYEPADLDVIAVEPSQVMIDQRATGTATAMRGSADPLPLDDGSVDAALAVLTVHHGPDLARAWSEIRQVVRQRAVFLTFDPASRSGRPCLRI